MKLKIAIFNSYFSKDYLNQEIAALAPSCEIETFYYNSPEEIAPVFEQIQNQFDGFLTNGSITQQILLRRFPLNTKPIICFDGDYIAYYRLFLEMILRDRSINFSRVYLDVLDALGGCSLDQCMMHNQFPEYGARYVEWICGMEDQELISLRGKLIGRILDLWNQGAIDCVITRFSTIMEDLESYGIPHYFVYPSRSYLGEIIDRVMNQTQLHLMHNHLPAVISISWQTGQTPASFYGSELDSVGLQKSILEFGREVCAEFVLQRRTTGFEVITNLETVQRITFSGTRCPLKPYLEQRVQGSIHIGYGIAPDLSEARVNASHAAREAALGEGSYLLDEQAQLIGPLIDGERILIQTIPPPYLAQLAEETRLSVVTLQKILLAIQQLHTSEITARMLSAKLGVTPRAAAQFLNKLVAAGKAYSTLGRQSKSRGRPEKSYALLIEKDIS